MTRAEALRAAVRRLKAAGVGEASEDARRLLGHAAGLSPAALIAAMPAPQPSEEAAAFQALIERRAAREPLSHILGRVAFWTLDLAVTPDVLTPRADTETLVETALAGIADRTAPLRILDIGTGSGAIALALLSELPAARAVATDLSDAALRIARGNAEACGLAQRFQTAKTRWADGVDGPFDRVISNPPYIASAVIETLEPEVKDYEPRLALDGGSDGLAPYAHLMAEAQRLLAPGGAALFEIGYDQGEAVTQLAQALGAATRLVHDLAGRDRVVVAEFGEAGPA